MATFKSKLYLCDDFAQRFDFVYAHTDALKRESYRMRTSAQYKPQSRSGSLVTHNIDEFDARSYHLLLQDRDTKEYVASARLTPTVGRTPRKALPIESRYQVNLFKALSEEQSTHVTCSEMSHLDFNQAYLQKHLPYNDEHELALGLCLASCSLARLLFHDYLFAELSIELFKKLRANGMLFEYVFDQDDQHTDSTVFYLGTESGLHTSSASYNLYQHILTKIAHQLNMPILQDSLTENGTY